MGLTAAGALAVPVMVLGAALAVAAPPCNAPCLQNARAELRTCTMQARASFQEGVDGCLGRDRTCIDACRSQRQECREDTGVGAELLGCVTQTEAAKAECRATFPIGSRRRELCIDRAQLAGFQCHRDVRRSFRQSLRQCRRAFRPCADPCEPAEPPPLCKADQLRFLRGALADCKATFQATARACTNKDESCIQDCAATRQACAAPTQVTLDAALAACRTEEAAALGACQATFPDGGTALQQCITEAQAGAFTCRDTAVDASLPGFSACTEQFLGCLVPCPPASSP